ncbi:unnamed protein product [Lupinus luteus]|uniref:Uncharacterized protein n=1 Tax=Lupinus luteus TaxID=3873 RepID=A0AAV1Y1W1_LUPLU
MAAICQIKIGTLISFVVLIAILIKKLDTQRICIPGGHDGGKLEAFNKDSPYLIYNMRSVGKWEEFVEEG